jgi:hypothetical protein
MYSPYRYIEIQIGGRGEGILQYEMYEEEGIPGKDPEGIISFQVEPASLQEMIRLHEEADFFNVELTDVNEERIRVTDVGTTTLTYRQNGKERTLSYGHVTDNPLKELIRTYERLIEKPLSTSAVQNP